ncbi:MAG: alpha/beta fold hydrolase [Nitrospirales bacterium]|nr:alpha/beta fold hydrolase [Nitrospirales bacterium]
MPLPGCTHPSVPNPEQHPAVKSAVIVVPGYYGTRLVRESDRSLVFVSLTQVLFGDQSLTLPVPGLGFKDTIDLQPDGILDEVRIIPLLYSIDVYGSLLDRLRPSSNPGRKVIPFTYDWRGDLMEAVRSLDALIHKLQAQGTRDISVIAHSMGGLIVSYYLRYGTQDIDSAVETWKGTEGIQNVVMAGVPFLGVMNSFRNMNFGVTVWGNSSLLSAEAYASFPASYYTLPLADTDELLTPELKPLQGLIRNAAQWQRSEWGLFKNRKSLSNDLVERRADYTSLWLRRSQRFLELLRAPTTKRDSTFPHLLYLYAKGTPTLAKGIWAGNQITGPDSLVFEDPESVEAHQEGLANGFFVDGDGTVTVPSALLPSAYQQTFPTTVREYEIGHTELVTDGDIQEDIVIFLDNHTPRILVGD